MYYSFVEYKQIKRLYNPFILRYCICKTYYLCLIAHWLRTFLTILEHVAPGYTLYFNPLKYWSVLDTLYRVLLGSVIYVSILVVSKRQTPMIVGSQSHSVSMMILYDPGWLRDNIMVVRTFSTNKLGNSIYHLQSKTTKSSGCLYYIQIYWQYTNVHLIT